MNSFASELLHTADPDLRLDTLSPAEIEQEAQSLALFAVSKLRDDSYPLPGRLLAMLGDRQIAQYVNQIHQAENFGQWQQGIGGDGASYFPPEHNPYAVGDIRCENCLYWQNGTCQIVAGTIEAQGICRLWVIPDIDLSPFEDAVPYRTDAATRLDGKLLRWNGLEIGITHEPGMQRFVRGNPMQARYGRIYRSWGKAEDGKAIDVYVHPEFDPTSNNNPIYRVSQREPDSGLMEERKYFLGYASPKDVRQSFVYHAGVERFGAIEQIQPSELDAYRKDAAYHADSCGCEACEMKAKKRKRRTRTKAQVIEPADETPTDEREDAKEPEADEAENDVAQFITTAQTRAKTAINQWVKAIGDWIRGFESLEAARDALIADPVQVYNLLNGKKFEDTLYQSMLAADLAGRVQVLDEVKRSDSLSDVLPVREDAPTPWFKMRFAEAIEYFRSKLNIPVDDYRQMEEGYHSWAFSVSGLSRADILADVRWLLDQAIAEGNDFETFQQQWKRLIGRKAGWNPGERKLFIIYDTNVRSAVGTGRGKQMLDPTVSSRRPLILWRWRDSPQPRPNHQALHNKAIPANHPFWRKVRFPAGFSCRCGGFSVSEEYCRRNGIEIVNNPPGPETIADEGFRYPLEGLDEQQRQQQINSMMERIDPKLREQIESEGRGRS